MIYTDNTSLWHKFFVLGLFMGLGGTNTKETIMPHAKQQTI